jgi:hypothetical protein
MSDGQRGAGAVEAVVGAAVGLLVVLAGLGLLRGMARLADRVVAADEQAAAAAWALDRVAAEIARAGIGVAPADEPPCPDEAVELLDTGALVVRGDLDADAPAERDDPESYLAGHFAAVPTANDEVVGFLRRAGSRGGRRRALFEADLDGPDRVVLADATLVARRDGRVETIDAGPWAEPDGAAGTLYRVSFVHDARHAGTGRFRSVQPLVDQVLAFEITGLDSSGRPVGACGGSDDPASRSCRHSVVAIELALTFAARESRRTLVRRVALAARGRR